MRNAILREAQETGSMHAKSVVAFALFAGVSCGLSVAAYAGTVWEDAYSWYRGGVDFNGNGVVEMFDFLDQRNPSTAQTRVYSQLGIPDGAGKEDVCFRTGVDVFSPMMNRTIPGQQCVELPQKVTYDTQEKGTANLAIFRFPRFITDDTYSAIIRFKPAEDVVNTDASWLLNFGADWGTKTGVIVGFKYVTPDTSKLCCQVGGNLAWPEASNWGNDNDGGGIYGTDLVISNNVWTEMSVVVNGRTLRIGVTQAGAPTQWKNLDLNASWTRGTPANHSFVPYGNGGGEDGYMRIFLGGYKFDSAVLNVVKNTSKTSTKYPDGYPEVVGTGATPKVFRGLIHEVAFWDRVLTDDEVREAFAAPTPNLARYGIPGLTATLFSNGATPVSDSAVVNPLTKQDFRDCRYKLASGGKLGMQFNVPERIAGLEQIVFVKAAADSAAARLSVRLDGKALRSLSVSAGGAAHCSIEKSLLTAGDHLLELVREDSGAGAFALDHMTIGGSFQMGAVDAEYKEMSSPETAPATTTFAVGNPKEWAYSIYGPPTNPNARKLTMRFSLPEGFSLTTHRLRYTFKTQTSNASKSTVLSLNGKVIKSLKHGEGGYIDNTVQTVRLEGEDLVAGENVLEWSVPDDAGAQYWAMFNYHRIECNERKGLFLVVK